MERERKTQTDRQTGRQMYRERQTDAGRQKTVFVGGGEGKRDGER